MDITVIFTCYNRKDISVRCINSLISGNPNCQFKFIVVDDNSSDGTADALRELDYNITIIQGTGSLFWAGGMRVGIDHYLSAEQSTDYVLLVNDDVAFYEHSIEHLVEQANADARAVIVGATCADNGRFTYGAMKLCNPRKSDLFYYVLPSDHMVSCDTFNCNCVLIRDDILRAVGNLDEAYKHSLADLDYGLKLSRAGFPIYSSTEFVGVCRKNSNKGTWSDTSLPRLKRIKLKESPKGAPFKQWFYFMNKNFGFLEAYIYSVTPYIKIMLGK